MSLPYWRCAGIFFIPCIPKKIKQLSLPQKLLLRGYKLQWLGDRTVNFFFLQLCACSQAGQGPGGGREPWGCAGDAPIPRGAAGERRKNKGGGIKLQPFRQLESAQERANSLAQLRILNDKLVSVEGLERQNALMPCLAAASRGSCTAVFSVGLPPSLCLWLCSLATSSTKPEGAGDCHMATKVPKAPGPHRAVLGARAVPQTLPRCEPCRWCPKKHPC